MYVLSTNMGIQQPAFIRKVRIRYSFLQERPSTGGKGDGCSGNAIRKTKAITSQSEQNTYVNRTNSLLIRVHCNMTSSRLNLIKDRHVCSIDTSIGGTSTCKGRDEADRGKPCPYGLHQIVDDSRAPSLPSRQPPPMPRVRCAPWHATSRVYRTVMLPTTRRFC
jgi:hypothetical protein